MSKGRPKGSKIRQNLIELLSVLQESYGYELYKYYNALFPPCTLRSIHFQLKAGVETQEFKIQRVVSEEGAFSWGKSAEKVYYILGICAQAQGILTTQEKQKQIETLKKANTLHTAQTNEPEQSHHDSQYEKA